MAIQVDSTPTPEDIQAIIEGVNQHNAPYLESIKSQEFTCFSFTDDGDKEGGLYAELWGEWLLVKYLWVEPNAKGKGLGQKLLAEAEEFAKQQECHSVFLDTYDFQAKPFYEKQGYQVQMVLAPYPISGARYYLTKPL